MTVDVVAKKSCFICPAMESLKNFQIVKIPLHSLCKILSMCSFMGRNPIRSSGVDFNGYNIYVYLKKVLISEAQASVLGCLQDVLSYWRVNSSLSSLQSRRRNLCGIQSYVNCSRHPPATADVWSAGVWQDWKRNPFLASGLHATVLCVSSLSCSLCVGIPTWQVSGGEASFVMCKSHGSAGLGISSVAVCLSGKHNTEDYISPINCTHL